MRKISCITVRAAFPLVLLIVFAAAASAQLGGLTNKILKKAPVGTILGGKEPITTSLPDAVWGDISKDGFTPREAKRSLMTLQRTQNGGFAGPELLSACRHPRARRRRWISLCSAKGIGKRGGDCCRAKFCPAPGDTAARYPTLAVGDRRQGAI